MSGYEDIIHLPHPTSPRHPRMSMSDRAAQFSPFAALTGYEAMVEETARLTDRKIELTEEQKAILDERLRLLEDALPQGPEAVFTYFQPDSRKEGGTYVTVTGKLKKLDRIEGCVVLTNGLMIPVEELAEVVGAFNE